MTDRKLYRAVLFDFDALADSYPAITASVNHVRAGYGLPPLSEPEVRLHVGRAAGYLLEHTVPAGTLEANLACAATSRSISRASWSPISASLLI